MAQKNHSSTEFLVTHDNSLICEFEKIQGQRKIYKIIKAKDICIQNQGVITNRPNSGHKIFLRKFKRHLQTYVVKLLQTFTDQNEKVQIQRQMNQVIQMLKQQESDFYSATVKDLQNLFQYQQYQVSKNAQTKFLITRIKYYSIKLMRSILRDQTMNYIFKSSNKNLKKLGSSNKNLQKLGRFKQREKILDCLTQVALSYQYQARLMNPYLLNKIQFGRLFSKNEMKQYGVHKIEASIQHQNFKAV